jgi:uncharacterized short protein YbdD (DUF466 family)
MKQLQNSLRQIWRWLREVSGDDAYERYLAHHRAHHPGSMPLERRAFFLHEQERKWKGVTRCC